MKNIIIYGAGKSGLAACELLNDERVFFYDENQFSLAQNVREKHQFLSYCQAEALLGEIDMLVLSPGISFDSPLVKRAVESGVRVVGETELAVSRSKCKIAAVTGTNGKTTVCQMIYGALSLAQKNVALVGNIGNPFSLVCESLPKTAVAVMETSSFQLEHFIGFKPYISAITNVSPDHLNRHKTMENYINAKFNICKYQRKNQHSVLNARDMALTNVPTRAQKHFFGSQECCYSDGKIIIDGEKIMLENSEKMLPHNIENMLCAAQISYLLGIKTKLIENCFNTFVYDKHRAEIVGQIADVVFVDDSKATNVFSAVASVNAYQNACVILGGSDKGYSFDEFFTNTKPKYICAFGETKNLIYDAAIRNGFFNIDVADDLKQATERCYQSALISGGTVLLAPACASFDMFTDYKQRGEKFVEIVKEIISKKLL